MPHADTAVAVFDDPISAEDAVRMLTHAGFGMHTLSVVGKGFHVVKNGTDGSDDHDCFRSCGTRGAFWGYLWGLLLSGAFLTLPPVGPVVVVGHLTATLIAVVEGIKIAGRMSAIGGTLISIGVPYDIITDYEAAIEADSFLVMAHGSADDVAWAKAILACPGAARVAIHSPPQKRLWSPDRLA